MNTIDNMSDQQQQRIVGVVAVVCCGCLCIVVGIVGAIFVFIAASAPLCYEPAEALNSTSSLPDAGVSVALGGLYSVIGVPDNTLLSADRVYVYRRSSSALSSRPTLVSTIHDPLGTPFSDFGIAVALTTEDAATLAVAAQRLDRVYVYRRTNSTHFSLAQLIQGPLISAFGVSIAFGRSNATLIVGAPLGGGDRGAVYVYTLNTTSNLYIERQLIRGADAPFGDVSRFGVSVALHANRLIVGAPATDNGFGAGYILDRSSSSTNFQFVGGINGSRANLSPLAGLGTSVAICDRLSALGAAGHDTAVPGARSGAVVLLEGASTLLRTLTGSRQFAMSGFSVALSPKYLAVGSFSAGEVAGSTELFDRVTLARREPPSFTSLPNASQFGRDVALSSSAAITTASREAGVFRVAAQACLK